jgi:hypothetical protein
VGAALYSSTLPRAIETATIIAPAWGAPAPIQHCGLCTYHYPVAADGMPIAKFQRVLARPGGGVYRPYEEGNESWADLLARVGAALFEIAIANAGRTAVLVVHNETIRGGAREYLNHGVDHRRRSWGRRATDLGLRPLDAGAPQRRGASGRPDCLRGGQPMPPGRHAHLKRGGAAARRTPGPGREGR